MYRVTIAAAILMATMSCCGPAAHADDFDSLINLELAFRDTILDTPAPQHYQALIRDGETTITFVGDLPGTVGKTDFFLDLDWSYDYRYTAEIIDGNTSVAVNAMNIQLKPRLRHVIRLPVAFHHAGVWATPLLAHEFDHVAVSLDPRPRALLVHLCRNLPTYRFTINGQTKPSDEPMREGINREIRRRQSAVLDLLRANYVALDKVSKHGRQAIEQRDEFFETLYTRQNLEAAGFPFLRQADSLLASQSYQRLGPRHLASPPAAR